MSDLINTLLGTGFRAAISPITLAICIALLDTNKPRVNSISYVLGYTFLHVVLAILAFFIGGLIGGAGQMPPSIEAGIKIALGLLLIAFGVVAWFKARRPGQGDELPVWAQMLNSITPVKSFFLGIIAWFNNLTTLIFYIAGLQALVSSGLNLVADIVLLSLFIVLVEIELVVPIIGYMLVPHRAHAVLEAVRKWLMRHNRALEVAVFGIFGIWLLVQGVLTLAG